VLVTSTASVASAALKRHFPAFEPTDLELEAPHTVELDTQFGVMFRDAAPKTRFFVPDFEVDYGLTGRVELDVDGAVALDYDGGRLTPSADPLWTAVKIGFIADRDPSDERRVWTAGAQLGPRWGLTGSTSRGAGFGAVLLLARMAPPWHVIANAGAVLEPLDTTAAGRSGGILGGLDLDYDLDRDDQFSLVAELAGTYSLGPDASDLHTTLGIDMSGLSWLDVSLVAFYGVLNGGDRAGVFLGLSPTFLLGGLTR